MSRIYYASQWVSINGTVVTAVQSVGISTTYNIEPVFQLGQSTVYQDQETLADVEVTIQRLFDGGTPMYLLHLGSSGYGAGLTSSVVENKKSTIVVSEDSGTPSAVSMTDMYVSNISYNATVDGNATEDITFIGNKKDTGTSTAKPGGIGNFGVASRQNVTGTGSASGAQSITISVDLAREELYTLGDIEPTNRLLTFPIEVTSEVEFRNTSHAGGLAGIPTDGCRPLANAGSGSIGMTICNSDGITRYTTTINAGSNNTILSVNYSGGDAGGGNASVTYSYRNYNTFSVNHSTGGSSGSSGSSGS